MMCLFRNSNRGQCKVSSHKVMVIVHSDDFIWITHSTGRNRLYLPYIPRRIKCDYSQSEDKILTFNVEHFILFSRFDDNITRWIIYEAFKLHKYFNHCQYSFIVNTPAKLVLPPFERNCQCFHMLAINGLRNSLKLIG